MKHFYLFFVLLLGACSSDRNSAPAEQPKPQKTTEAAEQHFPERMDWPLHGNDNGELRFSTLDQVNVDNVSERGLAWYADIPAIVVLEATPIVIGGFIYTRTGFACVYAL